jgi:outer membrane receptor protein involved in Fe transport
VYVKSAKDQTPQAFRDGDTWYFGDGRQANDGNVIFGGGVVTPKLADESASNDIFDRRFDPNASFEDYKPQINWLPRLAFSFPISKDANFFAHYDVLVQRPPDRWQVTPLDYLYFYTPGRTPTNNASLKPERVVDYEVGFQQKLTARTALKLSAYYREMRDMIQARTIKYVPVIGQYETYGNLDFGTVKGFTAQYELRRTYNLEMRLGYTLQFADGTGSDANTQRGLTSRGNLRNIFPLNYDERHNFQASLDYRFDEGNAYNGPRLFGKDILANFGLNMLASAVSGRPYTAKLVPKRFGGDGTVGAINGNRLPWRFNIDIRIDKSFNLSRKGKPALGLNVYVRVSNVLNTQNQLAVYPVTGSAVNDGFLTSQEGQQVLKNIQTSGQNITAYQAAYSWVTMDPAHFGLPRRIFAGASLNF